MTNTAAAAVLAAVTLAALAAGALVFAVVVLVVAGVVLADFAAVLSRAGPRPITLAAAVPGVGLPAAIAFQPDNAWTAVPDFVAAGVLAAFAMALAFGRRRGVTAALGGTALAGLAVGLGASGLLLLSGLPEGWRWILGVLLLATAVDAVRQEAATRVKAVPAGAMTVAVALLLAGGLALAADPPFNLSSAAGVAAVALLAAAAAGLLREAVDDAVANARADAATPEAVTRSPRLPVGLLTAAATPVLLAAPAAYALARLASL
ncbi:MAG TPA: hypothetical protein VM324_15120 [Egibacteraceae bacterium]|nr:hypothetical protein [Egibacteraceae bacterium]